MTRYNPGYLLLLIAGSFVPAASLAATCEARSGASQVALLELYTSEGCNSCPPADRWIAELPKRGFGSDKVVPLAYHVDYWNYLGWEDRFSQSAFTHRQREFARRNRARTVYTPQFTLNGHEYRYRQLWRDSIAADLERISATPARADISLKLERAGQSLKITGESSVRAPHADVGLYLALFENNLSSNVRAGENSGRRLEHEFVVHRLVGPLPFDAGGRAQFSETLRLDAGWKVADLGVAAFVQQGRGTEVLQALSLDVCR